MNEELDLVTTGSGNEILYAFGIESGYGFGYGFGLKSGSGFGLGGENGPEVNKDE